MGGHEVGAHQLVHLAGWTFHLDTLKMTWLAMVIVLSLAILATRRLEVVPRGWQNVMEIVIEALMSQIESTIGPKGKKLAPLLITLFLFILVSNQLGLVPGLVSPTTDLNTTLGLALMIVVMVHVLGVMNRGGAYFKHFFEPYIPFIVINLVEEIAKPATLALRLFGNILAGEVMLMVLTLLVPWFVPVVWLGFSVFVGAVQAFVFTMLSIAYLSNSLKEH